MESLFFSQRRLAESLFHRRFTAEEWARAQSQPKAMVKELLGTKFNAKLPELLKKMGSKVIESLPLFKELNRFVVQQAA